MGPRARFPLQALTGTKGRLRLAALAGVVLAAFATLATCGGCGKRAPGGGDTTSAQAAGDASPAAKAASPDAGSIREGLLWTSAKDGDEEDLSALAVHEGAAGLVEAATDPALRPTALRAMAFARGWAQLPFLAKTSSGKDDEEARLALESTVALAARPRTSEDPEDAEELREGCTALLAFARDVGKPRPRRVLAVRALRMLPCPRDGQLPTDVDAR